MFARGISAVKESVLLLRQDAVAEIVANRGAAYIESYADIGWKFCDTIWSL